MIIRIATAVLVTATGLLCSSAVIAQTYHAELKGIKTFAANIGELSADTKLCGISTEGIRAAFMYPISSAAFKVAEIPEGPKIEIFITSLRTSAGSCVSYVEFEVRTFQHVKIQFSQRDVFSTVSHWRNGSMFLSAQKDHATVVYRAIEDLTKQFITTWNFDNK